MGRSSLTDVLSDTIGVLAPFWEILDQVSKHGRHAVNGLGVIVEEDLFLASVPIVGEVRQEQLIISPCRMLL